MRIPYVVIALIFSQGLCVSSSASPFLPAAIVMPWRRKLPAHSPWDKKSFKRFAEVRAGQKTKGSWWHSEGTITETHTGRVVARVEGLEVCRGVRHPGSSLCWWDAIASVITKKLYIFKDPVTGAVMQHSLSAYGKETPVEAMMFRGQAVTYTLSNGQIMMQAEWADGQSAVGSCDGSAVVKGRKLAQYHLPVVVKAVSNQKEGGAQLQYLCNERYDYTHQDGGWFSKPLVTYTYTRFGPGPLWTGAKNCNLQMTGKRYKSFRSLPRDFRNYISVEYPEMKSQIKGVQELVQGTEEDASEKSADIAKTKRT